MTLYIPTSGENTAAALSNALWGLARPVLIRASEDTQELFGRTIMQDGSVWLAVDTLLSIPVHAEAELDGIADILQPFIDAGQLPANTNAELAALIESKRGQSMVVYDAFPDFFKSQAKTQAELQTLGLWPFTP